MFSSNREVFIRYISILPVFLLSLMLAMGCAAELQSFQETDLKIRYLGEHCRNADGTVGSLADKVREKMIFPATVQILSTNIGQAGRANDLRGDGVPDSFLGFGPFSFDAFQSALDDGEDFLVHRVQMELSTKSKANTIVGITAYAYIEHQTCAETWIILPHSASAYWLWTKDEGWELQRANSFTNPYGPLGIDTLP